MKYLLAVFLLASSLAWAQDPLDKYVWQNRLIVIQGANHKDSLVIAQLEELEPHAIAIKERKLKIILNAEWNIDTYPEALVKLIRPEKIKKKPFTLRLIGLDGGEKFYSEEITPWEKVEQLIDAMPMRRAELKKKGQ